jgi:hypothetical protein
MHLLFEGVTHLEVVLFLKYAVCEKSYFTVAYLNSAMQAFCEKIPADCKPNAIDEHLLKSSDALKQTAHQMWWLSHLLPLIIAVKIPKGDVYWLNVVRLLQIHQWCSGGGMGGMASPQIILKGDGIPPNNQVSRGDAIAVASPQIKLVGSPAP